MKLSHLNLCVVLETSVVNSTPPCPTQIPSLAHDSSSTFPTISALVIETPTIIIEDILDDTHLLSDDRFNTPIIPPPLEIPSQYSHAFSF